MLGSGDELRPGPLFHEAPRDRSCHHDAAGDSWNFSTRSRSNILVVLSDPSIQLHIVSQRKLYRVVLFVLLIELQHNPAILLLDPSSAGLADGNVKPVQGRSFPSCSDVFVDILCGFVKFHQQLSCRAARPHAAVSSAAKMAICIRLASDRGVSRSELPLPPVQLVAGRIHVAPPRPIEAPLTERADRPHLE